MAGGFGDLYRLYLECFPQYPMQETLFYDLLKPEKAVLFREYRNDVLAGFSAVHGESVFLLCVKPLFRRQGIGSRLLKKSEEQIRRSGGTRVTLGQGRWYLLQGVPLENPEAVPFFRRRGYAADWNSVNMFLPLGGYDPQAFPIPPAPRGLSFRILEEKDTPQLMAAVENAHCQWLDCFRGYHGFVLAAELADKIVGFEIVDPEGGRFCRPKEKTGSIGCVGVVQEAREQGIGMQMVLEGIKCLQSRGCSSIELLYVALVDWYKKLGFQIRQEQWMGGKRL